MRQRPGRTGPCLCVWLQIFKHSEGEFDLLESIRHEEVLRRSHTSLLIHDLYLQILELTKMTEDNEIKQTDRHSTSQLPAFTLLLKSLICNNFSLKHSRSEYKM